MRKVFLLFSLFFVGIVLHAQQIDRFDCSVMVDGVEVLNPFTGGFEAPQFSQTDYDNDGDLDLFVYDRAGNVVTFFLYDNGQYIFSPEVKRKYPPIDGWALLADYNNDGVEDLFMASTPNFDAVEVRTGQRNGNEIDYTLLEFPGDAEDILYFQLGSTRTNVTVERNDIPAIIDVDNDGDLDVLAFSPGGSEIFYYKNEVIENGQNFDRFTMVLDDICFGKIEEAGFTEEIFLSDDPNTCASDFTTKDTDEEEKLHSGSTILALDGDGDGDKELLIGDLASNGLIYLENGGSINNAYMINQDTEFPSYDREVNIPTFTSAYYVDVDNDGARDLIAAPNQKNNVANIENIWLYNNIGTDAAPVFEFTQNNYLQETTLDFGSFSSPVFQDINQDGLIDLIVGTSGRYDPNLVNDLRLLYYVNVGTVTTPIFELADDNWLNFNDFKETSTRPGLAFGDLDNDDDNDLLIGDFAGRLYYFENTAGAGEACSFANPIYQYAGIKVSNAAKPAIVDIDQDGLNDIVVGERNNNNVDGNLGSLVFYRNIGSSGSPEFDGQELSAVNNPTLGAVNTQLPGLSVVASASPVFVEDGDDYLLFTGSEIGRVLTYNNIAGNDNGAFTPLSADYADIREGDRTALSVADIDNDGFWEMIIGSWRGGLSFFNTDYPVNLMSAVDSEIVDTPDIRLYPIPAENRVYVNSKESLSNIIIRDISGAKVLDIVLDTNKEIDISALGVGMYLVEIYCSKKVYVEKLVVAR